MKKVIMPHRYKRLFVRMCIELALLMSLSITANAQEAKTKLLTDKDFSLLYICKVDVKNDTCLEISTEDAQMLMKIAYHEDHTNEVSQAYIMSEVLNRVASPDYPNSIKEVLNQKGQFLNTDSDEFNSIEPDVNSHLGLYLIESGQVQTDFLFHESLDSENSWQSKHRKVSLEYGGTRFYR